MLEDLEFGSQEETGFYIYIYINIILVRKKCLMISLCYLICL